MIAKLIESTSTVNDDEGFLGNSVAEEHKYWPFLKLFEQFGEAIPQFVIGITFYSKNYHWLNENEVLFAIVTMTLSLGSIIIGVVNGCITSFVLCLDYDDE